MTTPSDKQISYAMALLAENGYPTGYMDVTFKPLASMRERFGTVENWLRNMNKEEISNLIDQLKG